jgi:hypothetical protein
MFDRTTSINFLAPRRQEREGKFSCFPNLAPFAPLRDSSLFRIVFKPFFTTETPSSPRSEYFLIKNSFLSVLSVQNPNPCQRQSKEEWSSPRSTRRARRKKKVFQDSMLLRYPIFVSFATFVVSKLFTEFTIETKRFTEVLKTKSFSIFFFSQRPPRLRGESSLPDS